MILLLIEPIAKLLILVKSPFWRQFLPPLLAYPFGYVLVGMARTSKPVLKIVAKITDFSKVRSFAIGSIFLLFPLQGGEISALFNSLNPKSVAEALAFYELYPESEEGKKALERVTHLLHASSADSVAFLTRLVNRLQGVDISDSEIELIEKLASHFPNRKLKGYRAEGEREIVALPAEEIDLGRALILSQLHGKEDAAKMAKRYSALLDLMALQIQAELPDEPTVLEKVEATNHYIFDQMHFRFPPHSVYAENVDLYTFLPSVMDNHLGVCLGVTALYLAIAQRLDLPLEIITPPGHIYVRCPLGEKHRNIETTARGIHLPDDTYLSLDYDELEERDLKEVIGMTHVNNASTYLYKGKYHKAAEAYEKALPYMVEDPLVKELLGYTYLFIDRKEEGKSLLSSLEEKNHTMGDDFLAGKVSLEGMEAVFMLVDETRESILLKQKRLQKILESYPEFKDGLHQLAITWIQLNRSREAIDTLTRCHTLDPGDVTTTYYLAALYGERRDYKNCWHYLKKAEQLAAPYRPKLLHDLRRELTLVCPE